MLHYLINGNQGAINSNPSMQRLHLDEEIKLSGNFTPARTRGVDSIALIKVQYLTVFLVFVKLAKKLVLN